jgi:SAM-dependent methyltransferase
MELYSSYDDEPETHFSPLTEALYSDLYEIEMEDFRDDIGFYSKYLPEKCSILELGCGTGRVTHTLAGKDRKVTGIDTSLHMLNKAAERNNDNCSYICMDIRQLAFKLFFDAILIPYNTLNLLYKKTDALSCLKECRSLLTDGGKLYLQLYIPDNQLRSHKGNIFQFQMFNRPGGGKIIKESLKQYSSQTKTITVEERYRIRPTQRLGDNQDWNHLFSIAALSHEEWLSLFSQAGLHVVKAFGSYDLTLYDGNSSCLLVILADGSL